MGGQSENPLSCLTPNILFNACYFSVQSPPLRNSKVLVLNFEFRTPLEFRLGTPQHKNSFYKSKVCFFKQKGLHAFFTCPTFIKKVCKIYQLVCPTFIFNVRCLTI